MLLLIVAMTAVNAAGFTANAIARLWDGNFPGLPGYEDAVTLLIGVAALSMFPYCQLHSGHAAVDIFTQRAPAAFNRAVFLLSSVVTIGVALFFAYMLVQGVLQLKGDNVETAVLGWPVWGFAASGIISCALWAIATGLQVMGERNGA